MISGAGNNLNEVFTERELGLLQLSAVLHYLRETNPNNGLVRDKTDPNAPVSIAACGMALATISVVVERQVMYQDFAAKITLKRLRYLSECAQGPQPDASGYKGFYYHFLDIETGRQVCQCELSTIDSAFLFAGALTAANGFGNDGKYGFKPSFNQSFVIENNPEWWVTPYYFGIDQGLVVLMIENYWTGLLWI